MKLGRTRKIMVAVAGAAALALLVSGPASACQAPASAEVVCAPDLAHWQATITVTNMAPGAFTLTSASLDTTAWAASARLTGLVTGAVLASGASLTGHATGLPLSTAGAVVSYAGRYANGTTETNAFTLARPFPQCDLPATTTTSTTVVVTTTTLVEDTSVASTVPATTPATSVPTSTVSVPGSVLPTLPATAPAEVLGTEETAASSVPTLARTGASDAGQLAFGAFLLIIVGVGLVTVALLGTPTRHQHRR